MLDGRPVTAISPSLDAVSRVSGNAHRLAANAGIAFQGSNILGLGFTMEPEAAHRLIEKDPRNADVLFPYLNGQDLNSRPDHSASRWVINFHDWPEARAAQYPDCFDQVRRLVKPERSLVNRQMRRERWWQFAERAPKLYEAIQKLDRVITITRVSKVVMPVMVPTGQVISEMVVVFASDDSGLLGVLSSAPHYWWSISRSSTMKGDLRYAPSDVFEAFPRPESLPTLVSAGASLDTYRRKLMRDRSAGLTATYNMVHDKGNHDEDIAELRRIHVAIDEEVVRAYGWTDLDLDHDFHETRQGIRYTVGPVARQEILDRLLELNQQRYTEERARGAATKSESTKLRKASAQTDDVENPGLFQV